MPFDMDNRHQKYECALLQPDQVEAAWPMLRELLAKAVQHGRGEVEVDDILTLALQRKMLIAVLLENGATVLALAAEITPYPRKTVLNIAFMGGHGAASSSAISYPFVDKLAQLVGADSIRCYCRESMARYLTRHQPGYERAYVVLEKEVPR